MALLASFVFGGESAWDKTVVNILITEGLTDGQIKKIMGMKRFPSFDHHSRLIGDQLYMNDNRRKAVVYSFDTTGCYVLTVLYDHTGAKK